MSCTAHYFIVLQVGETPRALENTFNLFLVLLYAEMVKGKQNNRKIMKTVHQAQIQHCSLGGGGQTNVFQSHAPQIHLERGQRPF